MPSHQTLLCRYHYDPLGRLAGHAAAGDADTRLFYQKSRLATQIQGALRRPVLHPIGDSEHAASAYTACGHLAAGNDLSGLLGFDGERRDPVTGHYLLGNGYRAFNPVLMRFNSPDSLSPFGEGGLNAYAYCLGDPVNHVDPDGHLAAWLTRRVIQTASVAAFSVAGVATVATLATPLFTDNINITIAVGALAVVFGVAGRTGWVMRRPRAATRPSIGGISQRKLSDPPPSFDDVLEFPDKYPRVPDDNLPAYRQSWGRNADLPSRLPASSLAFARPGWRGSTISIESTSATVRHG